MRMAISNRTPEQIASGEESPNGAPVQHLNYTQGLILFGMPVEDRDQFIADNDVGNMSQRELRQTINEKGRTTEEEGLQESENEVTQNQGKAEETADKAIDKPVELIPSRGKLSRRKLSKCAANREYQCRLHEIRRPIRYASRQHAQRLRGAAENPRRFKQSSLQK